MTGDRDPFAFLDDALAARDRAGLRRRLRTVSPVADSRVSVSGTADSHGSDTGGLLHLSGNNYLGFANHPAVIAAARDALETFGAGSGASRLITGGLPVHAELETALAALKKQESALVFPTGYAANLGTIGALAGPRDRVYSDALNHASLIDGCRHSGATVRSYRHADLDHLQELIALDADSDGKRPRRRLIVTDGVFSMDGDVAPLPDLAEVAAEIGALLVVDDAHGTAVLGATGSGTAEALDAVDGVHVHIGTLSKAIGSQGGFVAGPRKLIDWLVNSARPFLFTTALAPACAAAATAALRLVADEPERRERLIERAHRLRDGLAGLGYELIPLRHGVTTPIIAVLIGEAEKAMAVSRQLQQHGVLVPAIRPPTVPKGTSRLRVTVMATHSDDDIESALQAFRAAAP